MKPWLDNLSGILEEYGGYLKDHGKFPATIESYCRDSANFLNFCRPYTSDPKAIDYPMLKSYHEYLQNSQNEKPNSMRRNIIAIRQFFRFLCDQGYTEGFSFEHYPIPMRIEQAPTAMDLADLDLFIEVASRSNHPIKFLRDPAIIALFGFEGIKATELIALSWSDFLSEKGWGSLRISGQRARVIQLTRETTNYLTKYRQCMEGFRHPNFRWNPAGCMFQGYKGRDGLTPLSQISRHGIKFSLYDIGEKAGSPTLNSEILRQYAIGYLSKLGRTPEEIMQHFGLRRIAKISAHVHANKRGANAAEAAQVPTTSSCL